jgi:GntR family transcriptional regulator
MLDKNSSIPLWEQLDEILKEKIENKVWQSGDMITSENELCKEYSISRMTARSVITRLVQQGLLYRVPGKGTFVAEPKIHTEPLAYMGIREQLEKKGYKIRTEVLANTLIVAPTRIEKILNLNTPTTVYFIERIRYIDNKPLSIHRSYLRQLFNPPILNERLGKEQLCRILRDDYKIIPTSTKETLELIFANEDQAEKLGVDESYPLLYLQDTRYHIDTIIEYTEVFFKGDKLRINFEYNG